MAESFQFAKANLISMVITVCRLWRLKKIIPIQERALTYTARPAGIRELNSVNHERALYQFIRFILLTMWNVLFCESKAFNMFKLELQINFVEIFNNKHKLFNLLFYNFFQSLIFCLYFFMVAPTLPSCVVNGWIFATIWRHRNCKYNQRRNHHNFLTCFRIFVRILIAVPQYMHLLHIRKNRLELLDVEKTRDWLQEKSVLTKLVYCCVWLHSKFS